MDFEILINSRSFLTTPMYDSDNVLDHLSPRAHLSRGGNVEVYVFDINLLSLSTPFYYVLVSVSVFMALSTVLHSINSSDNTSLSHSVLPVLFLPYRSFQLSISV